MMSNMWQIMAKILLVFALIWSINSCAYPNKRTQPQLPNGSSVIVEFGPEFIWGIPEKKLIPEPPKQKPRPYVHKVRWSGEMLISLAKWYTGYQDNWKAIAEANPHLNPNRIFIGDRIFIPGNLLKRHEPMPKPAPYVHKVRWIGENISYIAKWYTGSGKNWKIIAKANPKIKSNRIIIGDTIIIPINLLKRRDPMPQTFLITSSRKKSYQTQQIKQLFAEPNAIELFEPIE